MNEDRDNNGRFSITHGMSRTRLYRIWRSMKARCLRRSHKYFAAYGGRGISVCDRWMDFFEFLIWALRTGYTDELTLERKDNDKGYSPQNCVWATRAQQMHNRRDNNNLTYSGETLPLRVWARRLNTSRATLAFRLKRGWTVEQTLGTPVGGKNARYNYVP